jgi:hypothetical protein
MANRLTASITRPNNGDVYAPGDVVGTASSHILNFQNGTIGVVTSQLVFKAHALSSVAPALAPTFELWLFNVAPAAQADNAAFAVTDAELLNLVGVIELPTSYIGLASGNRVITGTTSPLVWQGAGGYQNLFGVLVVRNAYIPVANEVITVLLDLI